MKQLDKDISRLKKEIARHRENLVSADNLLKDDEQYLKDLTARCEDRANDYDQRSAMRNDEAKALGQALAVLSKKVKANDQAANKRALLQTPRVSEKTVLASHAAEEEKLLDSAEAELKSISFLQNGQTRAFLGLTQEMRQQKARDVLLSEGQRIGSVALTSLAERVAADPFKKIKGLIQKLIERLLTEAKNEATKKGFCDTELGKARKERDFRLQDARDLNGELSSLEAKRDSLEESIKQLKKDIKAESKALKDTTDEREKDRKANLKTLKTAKAGLEGVNEALLILKSFYKQAAKASFIQASPVDEDTDGAGFSGNYSGKQGAT